MTRYLFIFQISISALYYITAPFSLNFFIYLFWGINFISAVYLLVNSTKLAIPLINPLKRVRLIFTVTLILLELVINLNSNSYAADNFHGLVSDSEVLITGITLGVLWFHSITTPFTKKIKS